MIRVILAIALLVSPVMAVDKTRPKIKLPQTPVQWKAAEEKAIAGFDVVPDEYRQQVIAHWRDKLAESTRKLNSSKRDRIAATAAKHEQQIDALLANNPPWYQEIWKFDQRGAPYVDKKCWGSLSDDGTCFVFQVLGKDKAMIRFFTDKYVIVKGIDTTGIADETTAQFPGLFRVTGTETFTAASSAARTMFVVEPIPLIKPNPK